MTERKPAGVTFESRVERQLREARDRGSFDDLPGAGAPLRRTADDELAWVREKVRREGLPVTALSVRPRRADDLSVLLPVLQRLHEQEGYPVRLEAADRGAVPVLQVDPDSGARQFYRRLGWREVGTARQQWGPRTVDAVACVPPGA